MRNLVFTSFHSSNSRRSLSQHCLSSGHWCILFVEWRLIYTRCWICASRALARKTSSLSLPSVEGKSTLHSELGRDRCVPNVRAEFVSEMKSVQKSLFSTSGEAASMEDPLLSSRCSPILRARLQVWNKRNFVTWG